MRIVERAIEGAGNPVCWVTGAPVGHPHRAVMFDKWIDLETPLGPVYLIEPVAKEVGALFGMIDGDAHRSVAERLTITEADLLQERAARADVEAELADLKRVVERYYTTAQVTDTASLTPKKKAGVK